MLFQDKLLSLSDFFFFIYIFLSSFVTFISIKCNLC